MIDVPTIIGADERGTVFWIIYPFAGRVFLCYLNKQCDAIFKYTVEMHYPMP